MLGTSFGLTFVRDGEELKLRDIKLLAVSISFLLTGNILLGCVWVGCADRGLVEDTCCLQYLVYPVCIGSKF